MYLKMVNAMAKNHYGFVLYDTLYCANGILNIDFRVPCAWTGDLRMKLDWTPIRLDGGKTISLNFPASRFFGLGNSIFFDRTTSMRIQYTSTIPIGTRRTNEFGNFYIIENGILKASSSSGTFPAYTNYVDICLSVADTRDYIYFHSLEISGENGHTQHMIIKPAIDEFGNVCLLDTISMQAFYVSDPTKQQYLYVI